jgi:hypothetical protein
MRTLGWSGLTLGRRKGSKFSADLQLTSSLTPLPKQAHAHCAPRPSAETPGRDDLPKPPSGESGHDQSPNTIELGIGHPSPPGQPMEDGITVAELKLPTDDDVAEVDAFSRLFADWLQV